MSSPMNPAGGRLTTAEGARTRGSWLPWVLLAYALLVSTYFVVRPGSHWSENDTGQQALAIRSVGQSAMLVPESGYVYSQGYGYPVVSNVLMAVTGLGVQQLQQVAYPLL